MRIEDFAFGSIRIDGITHEHDVVIEGKKIRKLFPAKALAFGSARPTKKFSQYDCRGLPAATLLALSIPIVIAVPVALGAPLTMIWVIPPVCLSLAMHGHAQSCSEHERTNSMRNF